LTTDTIAFQVKPGPTLTLPVAQIVNMLQSKALPPSEVLKQVDMLVARLGAESFKDREDATAELIKLGPSIAPRLEKYLKDPDPEVRQRVGVILEKASVSKDQPDNVGGGAIFLNGAGGFIR
jgi:hypothetical protein